MGFRGNPAAVGDGGCADPSMIAFGAATKTNDEERHMHAYGAMDG